MPSFRKYMTAHRFRGYRRQWKKKDEDEGEDNVLRFLGQRWLVPHMRFLYKSTLRQRNTPLLFTYMALSFAVRYIAALGLFWSFRESIIHFKPPLVFMCYSFRNTSKSTYEILCLSIYTVLKELLTHNSVWNFDSLVRSEPYKRVSFSTMKSIQLANGTFISKGRKELFCSIPSSVVSWRHDTAKLARRGMGTTGQNDVERNKCVLLILFWAWNMWARSSLHKINFMVSIFMCRPPRNERDLFWRYKKIRSLTM